MYNQFMSEKPPKIEYEDQDMVYEKARDFLVEKVATIEAVDEAIIWGSLADRKFGNYSHPHHDGRTGSDIDLVLILDKEKEEFKLPDDWYFTTVEKSCFDLYSSREKFVHKGHKHKIDGLVVFPSKHSLQEVRDMIGDRGVSIFNRNEESLLVKYNVTKKE